MTELRPAQLIFSGELGPRTKSVFFQTMFNLAFASVGTLLSFPLMLLSAAAVRLSSPGPILYRQKRVGQDGGTFTVYKFRSMCVDAEAATGAVWATKDDPRITPVGGVMRKLRLDELPQLFNVLRGEMSIVGPVRSGRNLSRRSPSRSPTTGSGIASTRESPDGRRSTTSTATRWKIRFAKLEYDLYYIKNMSQSLDIYIIFHTVKTMLLTRGAQ